MTERITRFGKLAFTAAFVLFCGSSGYAATGDSESTARPLTMNDQAASDTKTLVTDPDLGGFVFYWKWTLSKGQAYTVWCSSDEWSGTPMTSFSSSSGPDAQFSESVDADGYTYYLMKDTDWFSTDPATGVYYFYISSYEEAAPSATVHYGRGNHMPKGLLQNPDTLEIPEQETEKTVSFHKDYMGMNHPYAYSVEMKAGKRYIIRSAGGTADDPIDLDLAPDEGNSQLPNIIYRTAEAGNMDLLVIPEVDGSYLLTVTSYDRSTASFYVGQMNGLLPAEHDCTALKAGVATTFKPGRRHTLGSSYDDDIIDERLFVFDVGSNTTFYLETTGSFTNLTMELYDEYGTVVAATESQVDGNIRYSFEVPSANTTYYLGICQTLTDDQKETPLYADVTLTLHEIAAEPGLFCYDPADPEDDDYSGATVLDFVDIEYSIARTLWFTAPYSPDEADWFRFEAAAGQSYHMKVVCEDAQPAFSLHDSTGALLRQSSNGSIVVVPQSDGVYYAKVTYPATRRDIAYSLVYKSIATGSAAFTAESYLFSETNEYASVSIARSSSNGNASIRWGTVSGTAKAGEDYVSAGGTVAFNDGVSQVSVQIPLLPDMRAALDGNKVFYVRIASENVQTLTYGDTILATAAPDTAAVVIANADTEEEGSGMQPLPSVDPDYASDGSLSLGSFYAVLTAGNDAPDAARSAVYMELSTTNGPEATVVLSGETYLFTADGFDAQDETTTHATLTHQASGSTLEVTLCNSTVASLADGFPADGFGSARLSFAMSDGFGPLTPVEYATEYLCRDNTAEGAYHAVTADMAGQYNVYFAETGVGDAQTGYASITLAESGQAVIAGVLPDGSEFSAWTALASVRGADDAVMVEIPVYIPGSGCLLSGSILISRDGSAESEAGAPALNWASTGKGPQGEQLKYFGLRYDPAVRPDSVKAKYVLKAYDNDDGELAFEASSLSVDVETGFFTAVVGANHVGGVVFDPAFASAYFGGTSFIYAAGALGSSGSFIIEATDIPMPSEKWGFPVQVTFDGNGISTGVPAPIWSEVSEVEVIPEPGEGFVRSGYRFVGWRTHDGSVLNAGDEFTMPAGDSIFVAVWTLPTDGFANALDCAKMFADDDFTVDGNGRWNVAPVDGAEGSSALKSDTLSTTGTAVWFETTTEGSGVAAFDWKFDRMISGIGTMSDGDSLKFEVDGVVVTQLIATATWGHVEYGVPTKGSHTLRWRVENDSSMTSGRRTTSSATGYVDNFSFGPRVTVAFDPNGGIVDEQVRYCTAGMVFETMPEPALEGKDFIGWYASNGVRYRDGDIIPDVNTLTLTARWDDPKFTVTYDANGGVGYIEPSRAYAGSSVVVASATGISRSGYEFVYWEDESHNTYEVGDAIESVVSDMVLTAVWTLSTADYAKALDCEGGVLSFIATDGKGWSEVESPGRVGGSVLRSAPCETGETAWFETVVTGAGTLSFDWKLKCGISSQKVGRNSYIYHYDSFSFTVDGVDGAAEIISISGQAQAETEWATCTLRMEEGSHTLRWTFTKEASDENPSEDGAWIDNLVWTPDAPKATVAFDAGDGVSSEDSRVVTVGYTVGELPTATLHGHRLTGWFTASDGGEQVSSDTEVTGDVTYYAHWEAVPTRTVTFDANGGSVTGESVLEVEDGTSLAWPEAAKEGFALVGWNDGTKTWATDEEFVVDGADVTFTACWTSPYAAALDYDGDSAVFISSGDAGWTVDTEKSNGGGTSLRSGALTTANSTSVLTATVEGEGSLSFDWLFTCGSSSEKVGSHNWYYYYDSFTFTVDGEVVIDMTVSTSDWKSKQLNLGEGSHTLVWTFNKKASDASPGDDGVWLDHFSWVPSEPKGWNVVTVGGVEITADHDKAKAWCEANSVALTDFPENYDAYLLNEAPGAGGGIIVEAIQRNDAAGTITLTVGRTKDSFSLDAINGTIVLYATSSLSEPFVALLKSAVEIETAAGSATLTMMLPSYNAMFYKVKIEEYVE